MPARRWAVHSEVSVQSSSLWPTLLPRCACKIFSVRFCSSWKSHLNYKALGRWCSHEWQNNKRGKSSSVFHYARIRVDLSVPSCWRMQACLSHTAVIWGFNVACIHLYNQALCQMGQLSTRTSEVTGMYITWYLGYQCMTQQPKHLNEQPDHMRWD